MKGIVVGVIFTTGAVLMLVACFFVIFDIKTIDVSNIFQIFAANIIICCGIFFINKILIRNTIVEYLTDVIFIIAVLMVFGTIFGWCSIVPVWVPIIMAGVIYVLAVITSIIKNLKDTREINELLEKRRKKAKGIVT